MDCFMIGNGFDLHYGLPTAYSSFLLVVDYLCRLSDSGRAVSSVSQVISSEELRNSDRAIRNCYNLYGDYYDAPLGDEVSKLVLSTNNNFWFTYLRESHRLHPNWIDFEKEIDLVLHTLSKCFDMVYNVKEQLIIET
ncbi:MAG: hypothetical protein J6P98_07770, partial [Clostridia bacterium]|nr:hypothetical protein [Clostridia bacterium]